MTRNSRLILAGLLTMLALPALAQTNPHARSRPQPQGGYGYDGYRQPSYPGARRDQTYSHPPGHTGTIYWNTPNADGNLGGPSAGGTAGSSGG